MTYSEQDRRVRENLLRLAAAREDSALADFAKDVLAGRREFRELASSSVVAEELIRDATPLLDAWAKASDAEREDVVARAPEAQARINAALADLDPETLTHEEKTPQQPSSVTTEDDDWSDWSIRDHADPV